MNKMNLNIAGKWLCCDVQLFGWRQHSRSLWNIQGLSIPWCIWVSHHYRSGRFFGLEWIFQQIKKCISFLIKRLVLLIVRNEISLFTREAEVCLLCGETALSQGQILWAGFRLLCERWDKVKPAFHCSATGSGCIKGRKRVKRREKRERCGMVCIFNTVLWDSSDQPCIKTHVRFQYTHPFVCDPSIRSSLHHLIIHPLFGSCLMGLSPADHTVPACGANISHYGACNVGITPLCSVLSAPTRQLLSTDGTSSLQPAPILLRSGCSFMKAKSHLQGFNNWLHGDIWFASFWLSPVNEDLATERRGGDVLMCHAGRAGSVSQKHSRFFLSLWLLH